MSQLSALSIVSSPIGSWAEVSLPRRTSGVTALCRRDIKRVQASSVEYKIPYAFDSACDLCRSPEINAIFVATPNSSHLNDVLLAIESGKPALCEKPMGMNAAECREMVEAARESNLPLGVAEVFRFERSTATLRERVAAGLIGKPILARSEFSFPVRTHPRAWITNIKIAGGGPIADVGVHCIDALRYILADEVVRVATIGVSDNASGDVEATAVLSLEFVRGTLASVLVSARAEYRTPFEIVGETGTLRGTMRSVWNGPLRLNCAEEEVSSTRKLCRMLMHMRAKWTHSLRLLKVRLNSRFRARKAGRIRRSWMRPIVA
jgi:predicted dehydrogenase